MKKRRYLLPDEPGRHGQRSPLLAPLDHPLLFVAIFLPFVLALIAASFFGPLRLFHFLIPGVWCYGVGGLLTQSIATGILRDNSGLLDRRRHPLRFFSKLCLWLILYLVIGAYPLLDNLLTPRPTPQP